MFNLMLAMEEVEVARRPEIEVQPRLTLAEGLELVQARLAELGLIISPSQPETPAVGNCFVEALWDQLNQLENEALLNHYESPSELRTKIVCNLQYYLDIGRMLWIVDDNLDVNGDGNIGRTPQQWVDYMSQDGVFCDNIFVQLAAIVLNRDIVTVPVFPESAAINRMFSVYKSAGDDGPFSKFPPLYVLYFESWRFISAHYQSVRPSPNHQNVVTDYLHRNRTTSTGSSFSWFHDSCKNLNVYIIVFVISLGLQDVDLRQEDQVEEVVATAVLPVLHILPDMAVDPLQQQEGATVVVPLLPGMAEEMLVAFDLVQQQEEEV